MGRIAQQGFTLVEVLIVVAIIGILLAIAVPGYYRARELTRARACQSNLVRIAGAVEIYVLENNVAADQSVQMAALIREDGAGHLKSRPVCPSQGQYGETIALGKGPECSLGINTDEPHLSHTMAAAAGQATFQ